MNDPTFSNLLRGWHRGDRAALEQLIANHLEWVAAYIHGRLGRRIRRTDETQDLVQEAMLDVFQYGPRFEVDDESQFRALLARIVENNIRDRDKWLRRHRRDVERDRIGVPESVIRLRAAGSSITSPSAAADRNEEAEWVRLALELLEPEHREIIWLREWDQLGFDVIGERLGVSANTARMRFQRALPKLAKRLEKLRRGDVGGQ